MSPDVRPATSEFRVARDFLLEHRDADDAARRGFRWPELGQFNWALDWFDAVARSSDATALRIVGEDGSDQRLSFSELSQRSNQVANWFRELGVAPGDHLLLMLGNQVQLWESMLAAMKVGAMIIPATTLLGPEDVADRVQRGDVRYVVAGQDVEKFRDVPGDPIRVAVGATPGGWRQYAEAYAQPVEFTPTRATAADDPLLVYFTSGTTASPKLVEHTHTSYPVGHLSTMYWIGLRPGDVHVNVASPGWAKHAWSNVFAPWNAEATVLVYGYERFEARALLDMLVECEATTMCAPPTVWRMLIQRDLSSWKVGLRELVSAGEPLNAEVIDQVWRAWGITIRDGFGQTETTAQIGNPPGMAVKRGSMGRPLPGYEVTLLDVASGAECDEGEIALPLERRPVGLMTGYRDADELNARAMRGGYYHTGDVASRDRDGYITDVGRVDDVFEASDYRISPFELESVLLEHPAVAEAAVVPSPDPVRLAVPKAYISLVGGYEPSTQTAASIFRHAHEHLAPYKRIRRLTFSDLPKTISGKIQRAKLRAAEMGRENTARLDGEYREQDVPGLRSSRAAATSSDVRNTSVQAEGECDPRA